MIIYCQECNGKGYIRNSVNILGSIISLGIWNLLEIGMHPKNNNTMTKSICKNCNGKKYIHLR
jgi:DnaJ-class molecular chaperone